MPNVYFVHDLPIVPQRGRYPSEYLEKLCKNHCENQRARTHPYRRVTALLEVLSGILRVSFSTPIYALERIAKDSKDDHWPIMEVLTAYVRETVPRLPKPPKDAEPSKDDQSPQEEPPITQEHQRPKPAADIQAILTVLGRRTQIYRHGEKQRLNLANIDLRGADLSYAQLQGAILQDAQLQEAMLYHAQLQEAVLYKTQLQGAALSDAQLQGALLYKTQLQGAFLNKAQLQGASLQEAQLQGAILIDAQLEGAGNLTVEQLSTVKTLYQAHLDPPLLEQIQRQYPQLLEKP